MLGYHGITELCGGRGTGRSTIALEESTRRRTVYFETRRFCIKRYIEMLNVDDSMCTLINHVNNTCSLCRRLGNMFVKMVHNVNQLRFLVEYRLESFISEHKIELVVIDALDHICYAEDRIDLFKDVYFIILKLKEINTKYNTRVLIINGWYNHKRRGMYWGVNWVLGYSWLYLINTRILLTKLNNIREAEVIQSPKCEAPKRCFKIEKRGIVYLSQGTTN
jgi:hypothetical protein